MRRQRERGNAKNKGPRDINLGPLVNNIIPFLIIFITNNLSFSGIADESVTTTK
jgi:hypothetical protein